jgi:hypothetical protein
VHQSDLQLYLRDIWPIPRRSRCHAKAHANELKLDGKASRGDPDNQARIELAVSTANQRLNELLPGWNLTCSANYQLANRFAWAWKVASLGVPVILVYLGFLNANEMVDQGTPFVNADTWCQRVVDYSRDSIPARAWDVDIPVGDYQASGADTVAESEPQLTDK